MPAPSVPFDLRYGPDSAVYYRYGAYTHLEMLTPDGARVAAVRAPDGRLVPDVRDAAAVAPDWAAIPFAPCEPRTAEATSPLRTFRAFRALSQRGKGGVYQAVDLDARPPRLCVLKEGRRWGEANWDGRDGRWHVMNEEHALKSLRGAGVEVPEVYASFEVEGHYYLALEFVEGESLQQMLNRRKRRLSVCRALGLGAQLARVVSGVHGAGWAWRDCKPANIILTKRRDLVPLDFEGASPASTYDPLRWLTPNFAPPEWGGAQRAGSNVPEDLYALGAVVYFLLTGALPSSSGAAPVGRLRRDVPAAAAAIISALLDPDPRARPDAKSAGRVLSEAL
jgi:serine/threonine protein kinase